MDAAEIIALVATIIKTTVDLTPSVIQTVEDAMPFAQTIYNTVIKGDIITDNDLDALHAHVQDLSAQLQLPLPPEDEGTPST